MPYVSKYEVTRHYGGPEEGGWWYDRYRYIDTLTEDLPTTEARKKARAFNLQAQRERRQAHSPGFTEELKGHPIYQGRFSVAGHVDEVYLAENEPREHDNHNEGHPIYE